MLIALLFVATPDLQSVTQEEFRRQARACGLSVKFDPHGNYEARLSADGKELTVRDNLHNGPQIKCIIKWANKRHLIIDLVQS